MINRLAIIPLLLIFVFLTFPSSGQFMNDSSNETVLQTGSVAFSNESESSFIPNLRYIWSVTGIEPGQVVMVLNQDGRDLYGLAKYEPDTGQAWNAIVIGLVDEDRVCLVLTALKDAVQFSSRLTGTYDSVNGLIKGDIFQVSNGDVSLHSEFQAMWINPDISGYSAAETALPRTDTSDLGQESSNATEIEKESLQPESSQKSRYYDVRQDAQRILTGVGDISQIPIGMGGSGLS